MLANIYRPNTFAAKEIIRRLFSIYFDEGGTLYLIERYLAMHARDVQGEQNVQAEHPDGRRCHHRRAFRFRHIRGAEGKRVRRHASAAASVRDGRSPSPAREGSGMLAARLAQLRAALSIRFQKSR